MSDELDDLLAEAAAERAAAAADASRVSLRRLPPVEAGDELGRRRLPHERREFTERVPSPPNGFPA